MGTRVRMPFVATVAALLGLIGGVVLTYASVIVPRRQELRLSLPPTDTFAGFDPRPWLDDLADGEWTVATGRQNGPGGTAYLWKRDYLFRGRLSFDEQPAALDTLLRRFRAGNNWATRKPEVRFEAADDGPGGGVLYAHYAFTYFEHHNSGSIHFWAVGQGEQFTVIITIHES